MYKKHPNILEIREKAEKLSLKIQNLLDEVEIPGST